MKNSQNHSRIKIAALVALSLTSVATSTPIDISESNLDSHSESCLELISISASSSSKNAHFIQHLGNHQSIHDGIISSNHPITSFQLINNRAFSSDYEAFTQSKLEFMNQNPNQDDELSRNVFDCWSQSDEKVEKLQNYNHLQEDFYQDPTSNPLLTFQKRSQSEHQVLTRYDPQFELSKGRDFLILVTRDDSSESFDQINGVQTPIFDFIKSSSQSLLNIIETNSGNVSWIDHLLMINEDDESSKLKRLFNYLNVRVLTLENEKAFSQFQKDLVEMKKGVRILSIGNDGNQAILSVSSTSLLNLDKVLRRDSRITLLTSHLDSIRNLKKKKSTLTQIENEDGEDKKPNPHYSNPKFNPLIESLINSPSFSIENFRKDVETLSGENQRELIAEGRDGWTSRHSGTWGGRKAGEWLLDEMTSYLKPLHGSFCKFQTHTHGFNPNVICEIPGVDDDDWLKSKSEEEEEEEEGMILISAHQDSRGTFGSTHAGGADDDGSGTSAILAIARALGRRPIRFSRTVRLVLFTGEEQGLVGSKAYAKELRERGEKIRFMLQIDMIAYRKKGEPIQMAFPPHLSTESATGLVRKIAGIYQPELQVGFTPACCSDHQSFWEESFPATWIFERNGPIADPMYHNSGDLSRREGYSYEQLQASTKVVFATLLNVAGFYL